MKMRETVINLIVLILLLIGAALVFVWLAATMGPEPEPAAGAGLRMGAVTMTAQALVTPLVTATPTEVFPTPTPPTILADSTPTTRPFSEPPLFTPTPWSLNPERLTVTPLYPALEEGIAVEVRGEAPADCHPAFREYEVLDTGYVPANLVLPAGAPCTEPASPWSVSFAIDPLPPGHWILEIYVEAGTTPVRHAAQSIYVAPPGPTPAVTPTIVGDFPTPTRFATFTQRLEIAPENPTSSDVVRLLIEGMSPDSCAPQIDRVSIAGTRIQVELSVPEDPSVTCVQGITPWTREAELGPLPANTYSLDVYVDDRGEPSLLGGSFVVAS